MSPGRIRYRIYRAHSLVVFSVGERFDLKEYLSVMDACLLDPEYTRNMDALWDFRDTVASSLQKDEIVQLAEYSSSYTNRRGESWRAALLVSNDLSYGLARMFEAYVNVAQNEVMVFRDPAAALKWLGHEGALDL